MEIVSSFAERLKEYMQQHDMTFETLSKQTGIPAQTLNRYSLGQRTPKVDKAIEIATKLNVDPLWLQGFNVEDEKKIIKLEQNVATTLTDKLDFLMKERGINRKEFSRQSGIPYMTIVNFYEKGTENVKLSTLKK